MEDLFGLVLLLWVKTGSEVFVEPVFAFELLPLNKGSLLPPYIIGVCANKD